VAAEQIKPQIEGLAPPASQTDGITLPAWVVWFVAIMLVVSLVAFLLNMFGLYRKADKSAQKRKVNAKKTDKDVEV